MSDLVKVIWSAAKHVDGRIFPADAKYLAEHIGRSDWLAQVRAEARRDALRAEADALERYTHMFTPDGGVYLSNIVRVIRRDAEFALADKETP